ncbi:MAG: hypothetical protein RR911_05510 [Oscillospiraceae bacterium]
MNFKKMLSAQGEKLKSQRNEVSSVVVDNTKAVRKCYNNAQSMATELATIKLLQSNGVSVAGVLFTQDNTAILERIDGITYEEIIDRIEQNLLEERSIKRTAKELCLWLDDYYAATKGALRGDINLRNFIFTPRGKCVSIDFEEPIKFGNREQDMGRILAYTATYDPPFTLGKLNFCKALMEIFLKMDAKEEEIHREYNSEIDAMKLRRAGFAAVESQAREFYNIIVK